MTAPTAHACSATAIELAGRRVTSFGGCNYLGLAQHPGIVRAARDAMARYGLSTTASRETTGNTLVHAELESAVTAFCGHEAGLLVPDGYTANITAMQALARMGVRTAVLDERAHASLRDAAQAAGMRVSTFAHLDATDAHAALRNCEGTAVLATDSVFSANGALAPSAALLESLRPGDHLLLDDCHGLAVLGREGRGTPDHLGLRSDRLVVTVTLAKGLGCAGGLVMGPRNLVDTATRHATAYICTTPCSPALAAAALESLRALTGEPDRLARLQANTAALRGRLAAAFGVDRDHPVPIIAFTAGTPDDMVAMHTAALRADLLAPLVSYPGGPAPVYFRLSVSSEHTAEDIDRLAELLCEHTPDTLNETGNAR